VLVAGLALVTLHLLDLALSRPNTALLAVLVIVAVTLGSLLAQPHAMRPTRLAQAIDDRQRHDHRLGACAQIDVLEQVVRELPDRERVDEVEEQLERRHNALGPGRPRNRDPDRRDPPPARPNSRDASSAKR
jgi:hypothetical protein